MATPNAVRLRTAATQLPRDPGRSIYDFLTFAVMLYVFDAGASLFQSGWFVESLTTHYDVSEMTIPTDNVDEELLARPAKWDIRMIRRFMSFFGRIRGGC